MKRYELKGLSTDRILMLLNAAILREQKSKYLSESFHYKNIIYKCKNELSRRKDRKLKLVS